MHGCLSSVHCRVVLNWGHVKLFWRKRAEGGLWLGVGWNVAALTAFSFSPSPEVELPVSNGGPLDVPGTFSGSQLEAFEEPCEYPLGCWLLGPFVATSSCSGGAPG